MSLKIFTGGGILPKLASLVIITILPIAFMLLIYSLGKVEENLYSEKQVATGHVVETAYRILEIQYIKFFNGPLTEEQAQKKAQNGIKNLKYEGNNVFWINDTPLPFPKILMHSLAPQLEVKVMDNSKYHCAMGKDQDLFQAMGEVCREDRNGYVDYLWPKPDQDTKYLKNFHMLNNSNHGDGYLAAGSIRFLT